MAAPAVSVIVPVYNRAHYVTDALQSLAGQTWRDFEVVVVDDGSTDASVAVVEGIDDPRIRVIRHPANRGIPAARNTGLAAARGRIIAWLDSDDVARPHRLEQQVRYLDRHPDVAMVGSCAGKLSPDGRRKRGVRVPPLSSEDIGGWLLFRSAFQQSSIAGRADVLKHYLYHDANSVCEDLDVFIRLSHAHRIENLPLVLVDRRLHQQQTVRVRHDTIVERKLALFAEPLSRLGVSFGPEDLARHVQLGNPKGSQVDSGFLEWADNWLVRLGEANARSGYVDRAGLALASGFFWVRACHQAIATIGAARAMRAIAGSPHSRGLMSGHGRTWLRQALPLMLSRKS